MKYNFLKTLLLTSLLVTCGTLIGCGNSPTSQSGNSGTQSSIYDGDPFVTELQLLKAPTKVTYVEGETIDLTGIKVKAIWNDGIDEELGKSELIYDKTRQLMASDTSFEVGYEGKTVFFDITVYAESNLELLSISVKKVLSNAKAVGGKVSLAGMVVEGTYSAGKTKEITDYKIKLNGTDVTSTALGDGIEVSKGKTILTIEHEGKTAEVNIYGYDASSALITQGENVIETKNVTADDKYYIERDKDYNYYVEPNGAYKDKALAEFLIGDIVKAHFYVEEAGTKDLFMEIAGTAKDASGVMNPVRVAHVVDLTVNGKEAEFENPYVHAPGDIKTNWYKYDLVSMGKIDLNKGDNVIEFKCVNTCEDGYSSGNGTFNIDFLALQ